MIGTFLASEIRLLTRALAARGVEATALLRSAGLDPSLAEEPRARYPFSRVAAAWSRALEATGDDDFGLEAARHYRATDFHGLAIVFLASKDLSTALDRFVRYHKVVNTAVAAR